jgi:hypothetical protein
MTVKELDYVAKCPECGNVVGWAASSLNPRELGKELGRWVRHRMSVERMATEAARAAPWGHAKNCAESKP